MKKIILLTTTIILLSACQPKELSEELKVKQLNQIAAGTQREIFGDPNNCYFLSRDESGVYLNTGTEPYELTEEILIEGADPKSIHYVANDIFQDQNNVYALVSKNKCEGGFHVVKYDSIDIGSFQFLASGYAKDKQNVFYYQPNETRVWEAKTIKGVSPNSFEILSSRYSKDKYNAYYHGPDQDIKIIEGADAKSFEAGSDDLKSAQDKNNQYINGAKVEIKEI